MKNVYDNAGHLERLGALARENEDLKRRLAELEKQEPVNARLLRLLKDTIRKQEARITELDSKVIACKSKLIESQGLADCMAMVRQEMIDAGVLSSVILPTFMPESIIPRLKALDAIRALLPDDLYSHSKDWSSGDLADRIEWLKIGYESEKYLAGELLSQLDALAKQEPVATYMGHRLTPEGTDEFWGTAKTKLPEGSGLYARPVSADPGKVTVTTDDHGRCVAVTRTDDEGRILSVIWEAGEMEKPVNARLVEALERIADPRNFHFAGDAQVVAREALAAAEAKLAEPVNERVIDRTWARFCGAFGDGPDAPYPGMIEAFETHYGQSFRDKDWRTEAACWAAAWRKAVLVANPQAEPVRLTDEQVAKVGTAICEALGEAYDSDKVVEIREAVLQALGPVEGAEPLKAEPVSLTDAAMLDLWFGDIEPVGLLSERVVRFGFKVQQALLAANGLLEGADNG